MSPFLQYNSTFDAQETIKRHAVPNLQPNAAYLTNYLGVLIDPKFFPEILTGRQGEVEPVPIPANWHADIAEWAATLRAVDLSGRAFTMIELGCGWGCWLNNTGVAARHTGRSAHLIGVEGDLGHLAFAREACSANQFSDIEVTLIRGIAAAKEGIALFPRQAKAGTNWGLQPKLSISWIERAWARLANVYEEVQMISLEKVARNQKRIDLLHIDIQGGEACLVAASREFLNEKVAYLVVGTHSREIEVRLLSCMQSAGWLLEMERAVIFSLANGVPQLSVDGVQGWRNPRLLPL